MTHRRGPAAGTRSVPAQPEGQTNEQGSIVPLTRPTPHAHVVHVRAPPPTLMNWLQAFNRHERLQHVRGRGHRRFIGKVRMPLFQKAGAVRIRKATRKSLRFALYGPPRRYQNRCQLSCLRPSRDCGQLHTADRPGPPCTRRQQRPAQTKGPPLECASKDIASRRIRPTVTDHLYSPRHTDTADHTVSADAGLPRPHCPDSWARPCPLTSETGHRTLEGG